MRPSRLALVVVVLLALPACQKDPVAERRALLASAKSFSAQGKHPQAVIQLRNALARDTRSGEILYLLAKEHLALQEFPNAFKAVNSCVSYEPKNKDCRLLLGEFYMHIGRYRDALEQAQGILEHYVGDPAGLTLAAQANYMSGDYVKTKALADNLLHQNANHEEAHRILAALAIANKEMARAEELLQRAAEIGGNTLRASQPLAYFYGQTRQFDKMERLYAQLAEREPSNRDVLVQLCQAYVLAGKNDLAAETASRLGKLPGATPVDRGALGDLYLLQGKPEGARQEFQRLHQAAPKEGHFTRRLAVSLVALNRLDEAQKAVDELMKASNVDAYAHTVQGMIHLARNRADDAQTSLNTAIRLEPTLAIAHLYMARTHLAKGNVLLAKNSLGDSLKHDPALYVARITLAQLQLQTGDAEQARLNVERLIQQNPRSLAPYLMHASALIGSKQVAEAERELKAIVSQVPSAAGAPLASTYEVLAQAQYAKGDLAGQRAMLMKAIEANPKAFVPVAEVVNSYVAQGQSDMAARFLEGRLQEFPDNPEALALLGQVSISQKNPQKAEENLKKAVAMRPGYVVAELLLANLYSTTGKVQEADKLYSELQTKHPNNAEVLAMAAWHDESRGRPSLAIAKYEASLKADPNNHLAVNNLAWLYANSPTANMDVALKLAQQARENLPENPAVADTLALILIKRNTPGMAIALLQEALKKKPNTPIYMYHMGLAHLSRDNKKEARAYLQKAVDSGSTFLGREDAIKRLAELR